MVCKGALHVLIQLVCTGDTRETRKLYYHCMDVGVGHERVLVSSDRSKGLATIGGLRTAVPFSPRVFPQSMVWEKERAQMKERNERATIESGATGCFCFTFYGVVPFRHSRLPAPRSRLPTIPYGCPPTQGGGGGATERPQTQRGAKALETTNKRAKRAEPLGVRRMGLKRDNLLVLNGSCVCTCGCST